MPRIAKLNHRVVQRVDLEDALEEFLFAKQADGISRRILGHKDLTMTRRYIRYVQEDVKEIHEKASPVAKLQQLGKRANRRL